MKIFIVFILIFCFFAFGCGEEVQSPETEEEKEVEEELETEEELEEKKENEEETEEVENEKEEEKKIEKENDEVVLYEDPITENFGLTREDILEKHGKPSSKKEVFIYEEKRMTFSFSEGKVKAIVLYPGIEKDIFGVKPGMSFDEIEKVLGDPRFRGVSEYDGEKVIIYFFGEKEDTIGEVELWGHGNPTERIILIQKEW